MLRSGSHPNRRALCIGVPTFGEAAPAYRPGLPFVHEQVPAVAEALRRFGYDATEVTDPAALSGAAVPELIRKAAAETGSDGILIVHLISHGHLTDDGALYVVGADDTYQPDAHVDEWVRQFGHFPDFPAVLFLLDLCHAGAAARQPWQLNTADRSAKSWVLAACAADDSAFHGRFSRAVANVLGGLGDNRETHVDPGQRVLSLEMVAATIRREVKRLVAEDDAFTQEVTGSLRDIAADPPAIPFFPNPAYRSDAVRPARSPVATALAPFRDDVDEALDPVHFMERAGGRGAPDGPGCFSGRRQQLRALTEWCDGDGESWLRVVTGSPGAGKSALIGIVVCAAHPALSGPTRRLWKDVAWTPRVNTALVAVHAR
jgi:hypothetical protein